MERGSYNMPQNIVNLPSPKSVAKHSINVSHSTFRPLDGSGATNRTENNSGENRNRVYLGQQQLTISGGNSIGKISILNRTQSPQRFTLETLAPPFYSFHQQVTIRIADYSNFGGIPLRREGTHLRVFMLTLISS